jgi:hypothetical protein
MVAVHGAHRQHRRSALSEVSVSAQRVRQRELFAAYALAWCYIYRRFW